MDLDITSPKQLNRKAFLKQLAVDLSTSERRILYRAQYVRNHFLANTIYKTVDPSMILWNSSFFLFGFRF